MNDTRFTKPAWLKSAKGQEWLAAASLENLCEQQVRLIRWPTGLPDDKVAYDILEDGI
jgi:hypothetical protein